MRGGGGACVIQTRHLQQSFHRLSLCPGGPGGLSLPLVAMPWAQLLGVPDTCSATRLPRPSLVLFLLGHGRNQACSAETTPISRPLSVPELKPMRPRSQEEQGLDVAGHEPFSWGERGGDFGSCSLEESQSVTRALGWDGGCQQPATEVSQALRNKRAEATPVWWKERLVVFRPGPFGSVSKAQPGKRQLFQTVKIAHCYCRRHIPLSH